MASRFLFKQIGKENAITGIRLLVSCLINKKDVIQWYEKELEFPYYFGHNWDALDECLRDLSWIKVKNIEIHHMLLPLRDDESNLRIYLGILGNALDSWDGDDRHTLMVSFSPNLRTSVERLTAASL